MDQVRIRAAVAAHGLRKGAEVTVAETPLVAGAINNGVFIVLDRVPGAADGEGLPEMAPVRTALLGTFEANEKPVPPIEDVELPDSTDDGETPSSAYDDFKPGN